MRGRQKGFSLLELLLVVAIIGILAAIAIPNFATVRRRSKEGTAISNVRALSSAENAYMATIGGFARYGMMDDLITNRLVDNTFNEVRSAYLYTITRPSGEASYQIKAEPQALEMRYFYAMDNGQIFENTTDDLATATPLTNR